ncbi:MAG: PAS domain S-box protein [Ginsengibacter sp.]
MKIDACKFPTHDFDKAVIKTNSEGIITEWSANAEKFLGYTVDEILGRNISTIFSNESSTGEKPRTIYEVSAYTKFNQKILVCMEHSLMSNENGTISGFCHTLEYISGDNTLEVKEAIMEAIVNSSNDSIISVTLEGFITSWNPAATTMFGYTELEVIGKNISIIIPAERANEEVFFVSQIKSGKRIDHFETVRIAKDGSEKTIELSISPIRAKDGQIIGISKILQDISYKKEIEEKKAILAAIVDSSDDAIISKTIDGIITSWNHSAKKMFGYSEEEALGKHISIIIPPERIEEETIIIENIRSGNKVDHFETERITKDGTIKNISVTVSPIRNNKGIIIGASKTARDISLRIEAEKQRKLYTERLKELNVYKDEFMVMASHELKTPITVIMANLQILKLLLEEDSKNAFVDKTLKQTLKLSSLIGNLFEVSKIQAGRLVLNITTFDVDKLIKEVVADMQQTTRFHQIVYTGYPGIMVSADIYKFEQVVVNILNNAIKYMPQPGNIYLKLEKTDGSVIFTVSDNGVGIPEKDIESIFERFYRVSGSASSFAGSGVGLYISSEIIKAHGGKIWAESQIGKGSTFYFSIPFV